ncbi:hypothetical protein N7456_000071 [Penicillium angulare]|uniref:Transcription initiation factor TFIID subunit 8 n=1 Tax=Penicillium angulare TaxID=116970 RepID=A0A9W9GBD0_9EURO|nr:hypothetical protein N7456_000071 [Penicillium angulare]
MASTGLPVKRSSSHLEETDSKRPKHYYHHHHRLQKPVTLAASSEPAVQDEAHFDYLMNRSIGTILQDVGFELADPAALSSLRSAADSYLLRISKYVRQSMLASRRTQPIPPDFEHALSRVCLSPDDLRPYTKSHENITPIPTLLPSPPPEDELTRKIPFLNALRGEESSTNRSYVPKNFPEFPSKHTYSATAVFTERDNDPRKIRERAAEDGRHGEEALRRLAAAAHRGDNVSSSGVKDKKLWGRRLENMETMFEKTVKGLAKKLQKDQKDPLAPAPTATALNSAMEIDSGTHPDGDARSKLKPSLNLDMGPIVNCERDFWRRPATAIRGKEEKSAKPASGMDAVRT